MNESGRQARIKSGTETNCLSRLELGVPIHPGLSDATPLDSVDGMYAGARLSQSYHVGSRMFDGLWSAGIGASDDAAFC